MFSKQNSAKTRFNDSMYNLENIDEDIIYDPWYQRTIYFAMKMLTESPVKNLGLIC